MSAANATPAGGTIADPARTTAVYALRAEITEMLGWFADELDQWMTGRDDAVLQDARDKLIGLVQRVDALQQLGPPSHEALERLRAAHDA